MASISTRKTASGPRYDVVYRCNGACRRHADGPGQHRATFSKHADAKRKANEVEADKSRGMWVDSRNPTTVAEYARTWAVSRPHRASTAERVESNIRNHIEATRLGQRRIVDVRRSEVQAWVLDRANVLAPSSLQLTTKLLRSIFTDAVHEGVIARSPAARIDLPADDRRADRRRHVRAQGEKVVPLTVEQVQQLADAMSNRHRALIVTQAGLGLRAGELLALRLSDIDFLRREVAITEQLQPRTRERVPLKTKRSRRTVPLPRVVADVLSVHIATFHPGNDGCIFTGTTTGRPYAREVYSRAVAHAVAEAGLPRGTTSHDLRHHYVSVLLDAGESVVTVAERIGDTPAMVLEVYGHMMPNTEDRTRRAVDDAWIRVDQTQGIALAHDVNSRGRG